ncbi:Fe2OG dioxygenase domain-containing protein [Pseudoscourfieldia marina]
MSSSAFEWWRRHPPPSHIPDLITSVPGLSYCADFLSPGMQADVLHTLSRDGLLFRRGGRGCRGEPDQANVFPPIPPVAEALLRRIRSLSTLAFPGQPALRHRRPLFDAMAVNRYSEGGYTKAHVDLLQYDDGIAIVSLVAPATLAFRMDGKCVRVRLGVGSLLMMCGSARYEWTHEVERVHKDERVSVVLRKLVQ